MEFRTTMPEVNGRQIHGFGPGGSMGWALEVRGPEWRGVHLQCWRKFDTLAAAHAEAIRLGPMTNAVET